MGGVRLPVWAAFGAGAAAGNRAAAKSEGAGLPGRCGEETEGDFSQDDRSPAGSRKAGPGFEAEPESQCSSAAVSESTGEGGLGVGHSGSRQPATGLCFPLWTLDGG